MPELATIEFRHDNNVASQSAILTEDYNWTLVPKALAYFLLDYLLHSWKNPGGYYLKVEGNSRRKPNLFRSLGNHIYNDINGGILKVFLKSGVGKGNYIENILTKNKLHGKGTSRKVSIKGDYLPSDCIEVIWPDCGCEGPIQQGDRKYLEWLCSYLKGDEKLPKPPEAKQTIPTIQGSQTREREPSLNRLDSQNRVGSLIKNGEAVMLTNLPGSEKTARARRVFGEELFADCMVGVDVLERRGTDEEMDAWINRGIGRLRERPNDIFLRAVLTWSIMRRGTPQRAVAFAYEMSEYLAAHQSPPDILAIDVDHKSWVSTINKIRCGEIAEPAIARMFLEDALTRASLLQWLRHCGNSSALAIRIKGIADHRELPPTVKFVFEPAGDPDERNWVPAAIAKVYSWLEHEQTSGLAYAFLLWLTSRRGVHELDKIRSVIEEACRWTDTNPRLSDPLVIWGTVWLAGMARHHIEPVFRQTRTWLGTPVSSDDRFVRVSLLWLAGTVGTREQVASTCLDAKKWFVDIRFRGDGCLRVAYLLWLMCRGRTRGVVTPGLLRKAIAETKQWLSEYDDQLVRIALHLAESIEMTA